jgi:DNA-binding MarR family transcriptional regulator
MIGVMAATGLDGQRRSGQERPAQQAGFLLAQLGRAVTRRYRAAMSPVGLKPRETAALLQLHNNGPMTQQDLGSALDIDPSNLVALLNGLEADGLAERRRDSEDRRRHVVGISKRGVKLVGAVMRAAAEVEDQFLVALDDGERASLRDMLGRVADSTGLPVMGEVTGEESDC